MSKQIAIVVEKLRHMQDSDRYGVLAPTLYAEYKAELDKYTNLDNVLKELGEDIDHSDKSEVQMQPKMGGFPPNQLPQE